MKNKIVLFFVCCSLQVNAYSQTYTLQQCVETALKNNIQLKQNQLNIESARINYRQSVANRLPSVNASASQTENFGRSVDPTTYEFKDQQISTNNLGINGSVVLFNGFRIHHTIKQNQYNVSASQMDYQDARNTLILNIVNAYVQVLFNKELLANYKNQVAVSDAQLARTQKLVLAGTLPESNILDLRSKKAADELNTVSAENQLNIAKLNLLQYMNVPMESLLPDSFDLESPVITIDTTLPSNEVTELYKVSLKNQPSIKGAELRVNSSQIGISAARGNLYPRLTLNGNIFTQYASTRTKITGFEFQGYQPNGMILNNDLSQVIYAPVVRLNQANYPLFSQWSDNFSQAISLNLNIPILNNYQARSTMQNATINRKNAELNLENSKVQLRRKIEQAIVDLRSATEKYEAAQIQLTANEESFRVTEKRFNAGVLNSVDYAVTNNNLFKSRSDLLQARYDLFLKMKILDFYKAGELVY